MNNFLKSYWAIVLLAMFIVITLFPPFNWYLSNTISKADTNRYENKIGKYLPVKSYEFIFNQPMRWHNFEIWEKETYWEKYKSYDREVKRYVTTPIKRSLIFHELILNYILSSLIIFLFYFLIAKRKLSHLRFLIFSLFGLMLFFSFSCSENDSEKPKEESYEEREHRIEQQIENISKSSQIPILTDSTFNYTIDYQTYLPNRNFITEIYIADIFIENDTTFLWGNLFLDNHNFDCYYQIAISPELLNIIKSKDLKRVIAKLAINNVGKIRFIFIADQLDKESSPYVSVDDFSNQILLKSRCLEIIEID